MEKISNYAFVVTTICMVLVYAILGEIRRVTDNLYAAKSISIGTLCFSIIWNFSYFIIHFDAALNKEVRRHPHEGYRTFTTCLYPPFGSS